MADVLHVKGEVLVSEQESVPELWVIDGKVSFTPPTSGDVETVTGYVLPGFVDAHCHVGLDAHGAVDAATSETQAVTDLSLIHISEPTRQCCTSRMPSSA